MLLTSSNDALDSSSSSLASIHVYMCIHTCVPAPPRAFISIVGFTTISSSLSPMQVCQMLNELYDRFDSIIDQVGVAKK